MPNIIFSRSITNGANYKWWVLWALSGGTLLITLDNSITVALPTIADHFAAKLTDIQWVVLSNILTISVLLLPMGRLSDMIGRKPVYITGFLIFLVGSLVAAAAQSMEMLIGARVVQGIGSAMVQANLMAMNLSAFPSHERGKALGMGVGIVGVGAIVGPVVNGALVSALGWRAPFLASFSIAAVGVAASAFILDRARFAPEPRTGPRASFDWPGAVFSGVALFLFLLVMSSGVRIGWGSPWIVASAACCAIAFLLFVRRELGTAFPLLDLRLFHQRVVALGLSAAWLTFLGTSTIFFLMPFYLQQVLGFEPRQVGLILVPLALGMMVSAPIAGRLSDRYGPRKLSVVGLLLGSVTLFTFSTPHLGPHTSLFFLTTLMALMFIGHGMFISANNSSVMGAIERERYGVVSALIQLTRNTGNVTGVAVSTLIVVSAMAARGFEPSLDAVTDEAGREVAGAFVVGLRRVYLVMGSVYLVAAIFPFIGSKRVV
jgi:EmrB/QacA subfamily drug resistance transporter